jgi:hypothetical protein
MLVFSRGMAEPAAQQAAAAAPDAAMGVPAAADPAPAPASAPAVIAEKKGEKRPFRNAFQMLQDAGNNQATSWVRKYCVRSTKDGKEGWLCLLQTNHEGKACSSFHTNPKAALIVGKTTSNAASHLRAHHKIGLLVCLLAIAALSADAFPLFR